MHHRNSRMLPSPTSSGLQGLTSSLQNAASDGPDDCDFALMTPALATTMTDSSTTEGECPNGCPCRCHIPSRDLQLVPSVLRPWVGRFNVPRTLPAALLPFFVLCNHNQCSRSRKQIQNVKYTAPRWFAHVEATIRFETFPIHFCIQTPRVVPSLQELSDISFDEFRRKLSTRALTLYDIDRNGQSVLHVSLDDPQTLRPAV